MAVDINELSEFEKGRFAKVKTRFDSKSEKAVCVVMYAGTPFALIWQNPG